MSAAVSLEYPFPEPPPPGETIEVLPGIGWLRMPLPFSLDHINLWLIEDADGVFIVDCGIGDAATRSIWDDVLAATPRVRGVVVTHFHPDHIGNAEWLSRRFGVLPWIAQAEYLMSHASATNSAGYTDAATLDFFREHGLDDARRGALLAARTGGYRKVVPELPLHYQRLVAGESLSIADQRWGILLGQGHSPEHVLFHQRGLGVLIAGDMVLPRISTNVSVHATQPFSNPLKLFLESLASYRALPPDTLVLPSHGLPFRGLHARIAQLERHHEERLAELEAACVTARTAAEVMVTLFRRPLDGHQIWFAMGETLAHLNLLNEAGRLERSTGEDGIVRFQRAA